MSFATALSGLKASSTNLQVTGNNIANSQTTGFKESRAEFADVYASSIGGNNKTQTGAGVRVTEVAQQFKDGNIESTQNSLDLAIRGNGFFTLADKVNLPDPKNPTAAVDPSIPTAYTRNGAFQLDNTGNVINDQGQYLLAFAANGTTAAEGFSVGVFRPLTIDTSLGLPAATGNIDLKLNINGGANVPTVSTFDPTNPASYNNTTSITTYDTQGNAHIASTYYVKTPVANVWNAYLFLDNFGVTTGGQAVPPLAAPASTVAATINTPGLPIPMIFTSAGVLDEVGVHAATAVSAAVVTAAETAVAGTAASTATAAGVSPVFAAAAATQPLDQNDPAFPNEANTAADSSALAKTDTAAAAAAAAAAAIDPLQAATAEGLAATASASASAARDSANTVTAANAIPTAANLALAWAAAAEAAAVSAEAAAGSASTYSGDPTPANGSQAAADAAKAAADAVLAENARNSYNTAVATATSSVAQAALAQARSAKSAADAFAAAAAVPNSSPSAASAAEALKTAAAAAAKSASAYADAASAVVDAASADAAAILASVAASDAVNAQAAANNYNVAINAAATAAGPAKTTKVDFGSIDLGLTNPSSSVNPMAFDIDFTGSTQFTKPFSIEASGQDGLPTGNLSGIDVDDTGVVFARYTNGGSKVLGQVALARFQSNQALAKLGDTTWGKTSDSGAPIYGAAGDNNFGGIQSAALEGSNVDLSEQLVKLIVAQQAYQANSQTITTEKTLVETILRA